MWSTYRKVIKAIAIDIPNYTNREAAFLVQIGFWQPKAIVAIQFNRHIGHSLRARS
jgi:hypothetical protein